MRQDLTGMTFGNWTVIRRVDRPAWQKQTGTWWQCRCVCGVVKTIVIGSLRSGNSTSCGCVMIEGRRQRAFKHGGCGTPEYKSWQHLIERCSNPACKDYRYYGARGITVCPQWIGNFATFYADMGARPSPQHSIERLDNDGPYAPENCQWATREQQATNRRGTTVFMFNGHTGTLRYLAERVGLTYTAVHQRIYTLHWTLDQALSTPPQGNHGSKLHAFTRAKRRTNQWSLF